MTVGRSEARTIDDVRIALNDCCDYVRLARSRGDFAEAARFEAVIQSLEVELCRLQAQHRLDALRHAA